MKLMLIIIVALTFYPVPYVGGMIRNLLVLIVLFQLVTRLPTMLMGMIKPRRMM